MLLLQQLLGQFVREQFGELFRIELVEFERRLVQRIERQQF
jgi:hypothetical protein